ncbi:MAG: DedA family protein [Thermodesulfobacteriota bacterium]|jgi:membrane protein DedA with SNARE-associated domain
MFDPTNFINSFPYAGIFVLLILGAIGFPFPEDTTFMLSGFLIANGVMELLPAFLVGYTGLLMADFFLYSVGKKYGRRVVEHKRFHRLISPKMLLTFEEKFKKRGILVIFIGRHLIGLRAQIFIVAGIMKMSSIKFLIADAVTALVTITLMGGIGYFAGNYIQVVKENMAKIEYVVIIVFAMSLASWIAFRYFKTREKLN